MRSPKERVTAAPDSGLSETAFVARLALSSYPGAWPASWKGVPRTLGTWPGRPRALPTHTALPSEPGLWDTACLLAEKAVGKPNGGLVYVRSRALGFLLDERRRERAWWSGRMAEMAPPPLSEGHFRAVGDEPDGGRRYFWDVASGPPDIMGRAGKGTHARYPMQGWRSTWAATPGAFPGWYPLIWWHSNALPILGRAGAEFDADAFAGHPQGDGDRNDSTGRAGRSYLAPWELSKWRIARRRTYHPDGRSITCRWYELTVPGVEWAAERGSQEDRQRELEWMERPAHAGVLVADGGRELNPQDFEGWIPAERVAADQARHQLPDRPIGNPEPEILAYLERQPHPIFRAGLAARRRDDAPAKADADSKDFRVRYRRMPEEGAWRVDAGGVKRCRICELPYSVARVRHRGLAGCMRGARAVNSI